jgi:hypothetical protein
MSCAIFFHYSVLLVVGRVVQVVLLDTRLFA